METLLLFAAMIFSGTSAPVSPPTDQYGNRYGQWAIVTFPEAVVVSAGRVGDPFRSPLVRVANTTWWQSNAYPQLYIYRNDCRWFSIVELGQFLDWRVPLVITPSLTGFPFEEWTFARPNGTVLFRQRIFTAVLAEPAEPSVPEPSSLTLILLGIGGLTRFRRNNADRT